MYELLLHQFRTAYPPVCRTVPNSRENDFRLTAEPSQRSLVDEHNHCGVETSPSRFGELHNQPALSRFHDGWLSRMDVAPDMRRRDPPRFPYFAGEGWAHDSWDL